MGRSDLCISQRKVGLNNDGKIPRSMFIAPLTAKRMMDEEQS